MLGGPLRTHTVYSALSREKFSGIHYQNRTGVALFSVSRRLSRLIVLAYLLNLTLNASLAVSVSERERERAVYGGSLPKRSCLVWHIARMLQKTGTSREGREGKRQTRIDCRPDFIEFCGFQSFRGLLGGYRLTLVHSWKCGRQAVSCRSEPSGTPSSG